MTGSKVELTFYHNGRYSRPIWVPVGSIVRVQMGKDWGEVLMMGPRVVANTGPWQLDGAPKPAPILFSPEELKEPYPLDIDHLGPRTERQRLGTLILWAFLAFMFVAAFAFLTFG